MAEHRNATKLFQDLNPRKLVELVADILAIRGHTGVKITDGPGDGCRDIASIAPNGKRHLSQMKYHRNSAKTVSSPEVNETIVGLVKFKYPGGLFVTNAKISPQAKRELLDNYPDYAIDFLDGDELANEVFGNSVLKALWFNGVSFDRVSFELRLPFFLRNLNSDKYLPFPIEMKNSTGRFYNEIISVNGTELQIFVTPSASYDPLAFEPYRMPRTKTFSERWGVSLWSYDLIVSGPVPLDAVDDVLRKASNAICSHVHTRSSGHFTLLAMRTGLPYIEPLFSHGQPVRVEMRDKGLVTIVSNGKDHLFEEEYIGLPSDGDWAPPKWSKTSTRGWARWYSAANNALLDIQLFSYPSYADQGSIEEKIQFHREYFNRSLFVLASDDSVELLEDKQQELHGEYYRWYDGRVLCVWRHPALLGPLRPGQTAPDDDFIEGVGYCTVDDESPFARHFAEMDELIEVQRRMCISEGAEIVVPEKGRYMLGVLGAETITEQRVSIYRAAELLSEFRLIPSPVDLSRRALSFIKVWVITGDETLVDAFIDGAKQWFHSTVLHTKPRSNLRFEVDFRTGDMRKYLIAVLENEDAVGIAPTREVVASLWERSKPVFESIYTSGTPDLGLSDTNIAEYWEREYSVYYS